MKFSPFIPRRSFLKTSLTGLALLPFAAVAFNACTKKQEAPLPEGATALKEDDSVAAALGYKAVADKVDLEKFPKRKAPGGDKQFCDNCQYYTVRNEGWGDCQILRAGVVSAKGWCNTWVAKTS